MTTVVKSKVDWHLYFIYFYIFVTPWHFSKSQTSVLSIILLIWTIVRYKKEFIERLLKIAKFIPLVLLFTYIFYQFFAVLWSEELLVGLKHVSNYNKYYFLFIPAILVSLNYNNAITALKILIISLSLYSLYSLLIYFGMIHVEGSSINNPKGHLRYLIGSQYMGISILTSIFIIYHSKIRLEKFAFALIVILSLSSLFINNSRTAQVSFLFIAIIFLIIFIKKDIIKVRIFLSFLVIVVFLIYFAYTNNKLKRYISGYTEVHSIINKQDYSGSLGVRVYFNKVGVEILKDNFLFGTGPKDNRNLLQKIQKNDPTYNSRILNHFHSEHMDTLTAYGIIGYSILVLSIVFLIYKLRHQSLYYYISLGVFLSLFFNSFANKTLSLKPLNYIYILFFLILAIIAYKKDENLEKEN